MQPRTDGQGWTGRAELGQALLRPWVHLQWIWECRSAAESRVMERSKHTHVEGKGATSPASVGTCGTDPNAPNTLHPCRHLALHRCKPAHGDTHMSPAVSDPRSPPAHPGPACTRVCEHNRPPAPTHPPQTPTSPAAAITVPPGTERGPLVGIEITQIRNTVDLCLIEEAREK